MGTGGMCHHACGGCLKELLVMCAPSLFCVSELVGLHGRRDKDGYSDRNKDKNRRMGLGASLGS